MSNKISTAAARAFFNGNTFHRGNTWVQDGALSLHNNIIAVTYTDGKVVINMCGWPTVTTRARLNAIMPAGRVFQRRFGQYIRQEDGSVLPMNTCAPYMYDPATRRWDLVY